MSRLITGPFNRVEGDLEITLDVQDGAVAAAFVNSPLYRGFEQILIGRPPRDALVFTPRICGICSVSQSMAAARALLCASGGEPAENGAVVQSIILATENIADHLTHFYMFFMPDFAQGIYAGEPWHEAAASRFAALKGSAYRQFVPARAAFLHIMGLLAGHWPHTLALQPRGTTKAIGRAEQARLKALIVNFRRFLEQTTFGDGLERVAALSSEADLCAWASEAGPAASDFGRFLAYADALDLGQLGRACDVFLSYGAYLGPAGHALKPGVYKKAELLPLDPQDIREDHSSCWLAPTEQPRHPSRGVTLPREEAGSGYTWCKAPRLAGEVAETGALARLAVDGHPLAREFIAKGGGNVRARVIARLIEAATVMLLMERWVWDIRPGEPFILASEVPQEAEGQGLIEAARGALGHWIEIKKGRIANYQIIAPTTWNFSPRDGKGQPGACEQALVGAPVRPGETSPIAVQHIVRSFDPCMVCTVH